MLQFYRNCHSHGSKKTQGQPNAVFVREVRMHRPLYERSRFPGTIRKPVSSASLTSSPRVSTTPSLSIFPLGNDKSNWDHTNCYNLITLDSRKIYGDLISHRLTSIIFKVNIYVNESGKLQSVIPQWSSACLSEN